MNSMSDCEHLIRNGTMLCELVSKILKVKILGVFELPKTESTCISNVRKALEVLWREKWMS